MFIGCGGIDAAYHNNARGLTENWVTHIKDIVRENRTELENIENQELRLNRLSELNVVAQVKNIFKVSAMARLIERNEYYPTVHGWLLDIHHGLIKDLDLPIDEWKKEGIVPTAYTVQEKK